MNDYSMMKLNEWLVNDILILKVIKRKEKKDYSTKLTEKFRLNEVSFFFFFNSVLSQLENQQTKIIKYVLTANTKI